MGRSATSHQETLPQVRTSKTDQPFVSVAQKDGLRGENRPNGRPLPAKKTKRPEGSPGLFQINGAKGGLGTLGTKTRSNNLISFGFKKVIESSACF